MLSEKAIPERSHLAWFCSAYVNCAGQSAEIESSPAMREEGTKGLLHHLRFQTVSWSVCVAATVFQTLIYKEKKLPAVAEECLTVLQAGRCWYSGTTFLLLSAQGGRAGSQRRGKREKGQARPGLARSQSVHSATTLLKWREAWGGKPRIWFPT